MHWKSAKNKGGNETVAPILSNNGNDEVAAHQLSSPCVSPPNLICHADNDDDDDNQCSMAAIINAAESGLIPIHPVTGAPSLQHYEAIT